MIDHQPDVEFLVILIGIWSPNDEIFELNYKFVRERETVEAEFDNEDGFWSSMPQLTEKELRK